MANRKDESIKNAVSDETLKEAVIKTVDEDPELAAALAKVTVKTGIVAGDWSCCRTVKPN